MSTAGLVVALHCWARSTKTRNKKSWKDKNLKVVASNSIARAQKLFSKMKQLGHANTKAYNVMMNILAKDGRVEEAEQLLAEMYERFAAGEKTCPNSATYNTLLT